MLAEVARRLGRPRPTCSGPCIVAGPDAQLLIERSRTCARRAAARARARAVRRGARSLKPVLPDPGVPFQLVHHDDVASALVRRDVGAGDARRLQPRRPTATLTVGDLAAALGWYSVPVPELAVDATA